MKVLITGFDPFDGESVNPALEAVKKMTDRISDADIIKQEIPTVFGKSLAKLEEAIQANQPDIVICVGQAGGRFEITPERIAINIDDARIPDNEGNKPVDAPIYEDGAIAYFSKLPVKAIIKELRENSIPCKISESAGTFVCNHVMYGLLYMIEKKYPHIKGGFIHVPFVAEQVMDKKNMPYMALRDIVSGLELAVKACVENA